MADDRQPTSPDAPPGNQPASAPTPPPPPGQPYGTAQGAPPPSNHPYGSPPPTNQPDGAPPRGRVSDRSGRGGPPAPGPYGPPPGPPPWGPQPAAPPDPTPEQLAQANRLARLSLLSAVAAPLVTMLDLPYTALLGLGLGILAIVLGARARRAAVVARSSEAAGVVAIVLGSLATAFIAVVIACYVVFWGEIRTYDDCMAGANTKQAEGACTDQLVDDARDRIGLG